MSRPQKHFFRRLPSGVENLNFHGQGVPDRLLRCFDLKRNGMEAFPPLPVSGELSRIDTEGLSDLLFKKTGKFGGFMDVAVKGQKGLGLFDKRFDRPASGRSPAMDPVQCCSEGRGMHHIDRPPGIFCRGETHQILMDRTASLQIEHRVNLHQGF